MKLKSQERDGIIKLTCNAGMGTARDLQKSAHADKRQIPGQTIADKMKTTK